MFKIGICDCNARDITTLNRMILMCSEEHDIQVYVEIYKCGAQLFSNLEKGEHIDLLFIEIDLGEEDGKEIVRRIQQELLIKDLKVVFISQSVKDIMHLFELKPYHFTTKPLQREVIEELIIEISRKHYREIAFSHFSMGKVVSKKGS